MQAIIGIVKKSVKQLAFEKEKTTPLTELHPIC